MSIVRNVPRVLPVMKRAPSQRRPMFVTAAVAIAFAGTVGVAIPDLT